jgi:hypothetical protein
MKNLKYILFAFIVIAFSSCEDVVDVDLKTAPPRLVVDASIVWQKGTPGNNQKIKLTTTTSYYQTTSPPVSGATVFITDSNNTVFNFIENVGTGEYLCNNFVPVLNTNYVLTVIHDGQTYSATETLKPVPAIDFIEQNNEGGFTGDDIEIKTFITDNASTTDFYLWKYAPSYAAIPTYDVGDDDFINGNQFFDLFLSEDLESGQTLGISVYGISQTYHNYMNILLSISGGGGPFSTPTASLRGNIINQTNFDSYALGYFSVSEMDYRLHQVE